MKKMYKYLLLTMLAMGTLFYSCETTELEILVSPNALSPDQADPVFLRLPIVVNSKSDGTRLFKILKRGGIGVSKSYFRTLPELYSDHIAVNQADYPGAAHLAHSLYTLPTHSYMNEKEFSRIMNAFHMIPKIQE